MKTFIHWIKITFKLLAIALMNATIEYIEMVVHELFDVDKGQLKKIPNIVIFLIYLLCLSVIFQAIADLILESLALLGMIPKFPIRANFIALTLLSTIIGIQTLEGMGNRKLDVTRNSILIGIVVESALIIGDIIFIVQSGDTYKIIPYMRTPFLSLTFINLFILLYVAKRMNVFKDRWGKIKIF